MKKYTLGLYEKAMPSSLAWKEKLEAAKEAGYDVYYEEGSEETKERFEKKSGKDGE